MKPLMGNGFPDMLSDSIWHTTHPDRFDAIIRSGEIVANPNIPDADRWKTSRGPDYYPYVRHIEGVSLFDFHGFDPVKYSEACPMSSWRTFVPIHEGWPASVWLKIDTCASKVNTWGQQSSRNDNMLRAPIGIH